MSGPKHVEQSVSFPGPGLHLNISVQRSYYESILRSHTWGLFQSQPLRGSGADHCAEWIVMTS